jgi:hypothetical protein
MNEREALIRIQSRDAIGQMEPNIHNDDALFVHQMHVVILCLGNMGYFAFGSNYSRPFSKMQPKNFLD